MNEDERQKVYAAIKAKMEALYGAPLATEEAVKVVWGQANALEGDRLDEEWEIALGRWNTELAPPWA